MSVHGTEDQGAVATTAPPTRYVRRFLEDETEDREEFACIDYTPITTSKPIDMYELLRPQRMGRRVKMLIAITGYNEDGEELHTTLKGIAANMILLEKAGLHWTEVLVACILDGKDKVSPSMYEYLQYGLKLYDPSVMKDKHGGRPVNVHVFERSVEMPKNLQQREWHYPMQMAAIIKTKNGGKLNSHLWMFNGFAVQMNPKYVVLFDVGTAPQDDALLKIYSFLEENPMAGGVCGEITIRDVRYYNLLDSAQYFEYKVSHLLDKSFESALGYISVLPGAFSAYRWMAIRGQPLAAYFTMEDMAVKDLGPFVANMFLAEDRILCFEIVARKHSIWTLEYVAGAVAETDCPQSLPELILQRRRWLNGSFFSALFYINGFPRFLETDHSLLRKLGFMFQFFSNLTTIILAWFMIGSLFLTMALIYFSAIEKNFPEGATDLKWMFTFVYGALIFAQLLVGLVGKARVNGSVYSIVQGAYAVMMLIALGLGWMVLAGAKMTSFVVLGTICSMFAYPLSAILHAEIRGVLVSWLQYYLSLPVFMIVFPLYSYCNLHDISWGTKAGNQQATVKAGHEMDAKTALKRAQDAKAALAKMDIASLQKVLKQNGVKIKLPHAQAAGEATPAAGASGDAAAGAGAADHGAAALLKAGAAAEGAGSAPAGDLADVAGLDTASAVGGPDASVAPSAVAPGLAAAVGLAEGTVSTGPSGAASGARSVISEVQGVADLMDKMKKIEGGNELFQGTGPSANAQDLAKALNSKEAAAAAKLAKEAEAARKASEEAAAKLLEAHQGEEKKALERMLEEARRIADKHEHEAVRAQKAADDLVLDKAKMAEVFNNFRMTMLSSWLLTNFLYVAVVLVYDPHLRTYSSVVTGLIIYAVVFKLTGSFYYVMARAWTKHARYWFPWLYRVETGVGGDERVVFFLRPADMYFYDDLWVQEHMAREAADLARKQAEEAAAQEAMEAEGIVGYDEEGYPIYAEGYEPEGSEGYEYAEGVDPTTGEGVVYDPHTGYAYAYMDEHGQGEGEGEGDGQWQGDDAHSVDMTGGAGAGLGSGSVHNHGRRSSVHDGRSPGASDAPHPLPRRGGHKGGRGSVKSPTQTHTHSHDLGSIVEVDDEDNTSQSSDSGSNRRGRTRRGSHHRPTPPSTAGARPSTWRVDAAEPLNSVRSGEIRTRMVLSPKGAMTTRMVRHQSFNKATDFVSPKVVMTARGTKRKSAWSSEDTDHKLGSTKSPGLDSSRASQGNKDKISVIVSPAGTSTAGGFASSSLPRTNSRRAFTASDRANPTLTHRVHPKDALASAMAATPVAATPQTGRDAPGLSAGKRSSLGDARKEVGMGGLSLETGFSKPDVKQLLKSYGSSHGEFSDGSSKSPGAGAGSGHGRSGGALAAGVHTNDKDNDGAGKSSGALAKATTPSEEDVASPPPPAQERKLSSSNGVGQVTAAKPTPAPAPVPTAQASAVPVQEAKANPAPADEAPSRADRVADMGRRSFLRPMDSASSADSGQLSPLPDSPSELRQRSSGSTDTGRQGEGTRGQLTERDGQDLNGRHASSRFMLQRAYSHASVDTVGTDVSSSLKPVEVQANGEVSDRDLDLASYTKPRLARGLRASVSAGGRAAPDPVGLSVDSPGTSPSHGDGQASGSGTGPGSGMGDIRSMAPALQTALGRVGGVPAAAFGIPAEMSPIAEDDNEDVTVTAAGTRPGGPWAKGNSRPGSRSVSRRNSPSTGPATVARKDSGNGPAMVQPPPVPVSAPAPVPAPARARLSTVPSTIHQSVSEASEDDIYSDVSTPKSKAEQGPWHGAGSSILHGRSSDDSAASPAPAMAVGPVRNVAVRSAPIQVTSNARSGPTINRIVTQPSDEYEGDDDDDEDDEDDEDEDDDLERYLAAAEAAHKTIQGRRL